MNAAYKLAIAGVMLAILAVSIVDVCGRYLFGAPLFGADDLIRFGMAIIVFAALPAVCRAGEHITVDLVTDRFAPGMRRLIERIFRGVAAAGLAFIAWRLLQLGLESGGERSTLLLLPIPPLVFFMSACTAIAAGIEFVRIFAPAASFASDPAAMPKE